MRLLLAISFLYIISSVSPLHAQEAPGEDVPGMRTKRDLSIPLPAAPAPQKPEPSTSKELSPQERQNLNSMFKGKLEGEKSNPKLPHEPDSPSPATTTSSPEPQIVPLQSPALYMNMAHILKFNVLNKQTTRLEAQQLTTGEKAVYGPLTVKLIECWHSGPDSTPESAALLEITEANAEGKIRPIFLGWMFSSTPSLNPLEHAVYDITVKECR